ncbi:hypothetical protein DXX93_16620 [Thalassotalea euphylliae]|uniref:Uncharacterized protein n=1 Tax=Thalassotalea euphylliae TaxID=1655234 RepID=A0A3E0TUI3_9GAMM|nr:hypothetical protein DXX93_16620 [Thalassotalea euphylliae]
MATCFTRCLFITCILLTFGIHLSRLYLLFRVVSSLLLLLFQFMYQANKKIKPLFLKDIYRKTKIKPPVVLQIAMQ